MTTAVAALAVLAGTGFFRPATASAQPPAGSMQPAAGQDTPADARLSPSEIAADALPAVVEIVTYDLDGDRLGGGSGFVIDSDGLVITSHHVLEGARRVQVTFGRGETYEVVHVAAADARRDLVILRIGAHGLPTLRLGDSRSADVGSSVVVIGSPLGLTNTVSDGLVSAKRVMAGQLLLQVSAPISRGSSGGPVFDGQGRVVGVLAGFLTRGSNVNFAVPIEYAIGLLRLPAEAFSVESVGRKHVSLAEGPAEPRLSLQGLLRGDTIPGETTTAWATSPRRVHASELHGEPTTADALVGLWELRELSRVPSMRSGLYRGVFAADGDGLSGSFFGTLLDPGTSEASFDGRRIRDFDLRLAGGGRGTIHGQNGCSYYVAVAADAMAGVYECLDDGGRVYDVGAVEVRRIVGGGPSGIYEYSEEAILGASSTRTTGRAVIFALPDGRWLGRLMALDPQVPRVLRLADGRWTRDGDLSARLVSGRVEVTGAFQPGRIELRYTLGGRDYPVVATLRGTSTRIAAVP